MIDIHLCSYAAYLLIEISTKRQSLMQREYHPKMTEHLIGFEILFIYVTLWTIAYLHWIHECNCKPLSKKIISKSDLEICNNCYLPCWIANSYFWFIWFIYLLQIAIFKENKTQCNFQNHALANIRTAHFLNDKSA